MFDLEHYVSWKNLDVEHNQHSTKQCLCLIGNEVATTQTMTISRNQIGILLNVAVPAVIY